MSQFHYNIYLTCNTSTSKAFMFLHTNNLMNFTCINLQFGNLEKWQITLFITLLFIWEKVNITDFTLANKKKGYYFCN